MRDFLRLPALRVMVLAGVAASVSCGGELGPDDLATIEVAQGNNQEAFAGTAVPTPPSVRALSANGEPIPGAAVTFVVTDGGGTLAGAEATSNADGIATVSSWTLGEEVGQNVLNATAPGTTDRVVFIARGTVGPAAIVEKLQGDGQTVTAGLAVPVVPSVRIADQFGNPIPELEVSFSAATGGGSVEVATATTEMDGEADVGNWTLGGAPGANTLVATAGDASTTFEATGVPGPVAIAVAAGEGQTATVGTPVSTQPQVLVTDGLDLPVAGVPVGFLVTAGAGSIDAETVTTDADGLASVQWTIGTAVGTNMLRASLEDLGTVTFTATGTPDVPATLIAFGGDAQFGAVDQVLPAAPVVLVQDQFSNPVPDVSVSFNITDGGGTITGSPVLSDSAGIAAADTWTLGPAEGNNSVEAVVTGVSPLTFTATGLAAVYELDIVRLGAGGPEIAQALQDAAVRWRQLVIGDLADVDFSTNPADSALCGVPHPPIDDVVDDVRIFVRLEEIDGPGRILGNAGPCLTRSGGMLTVVGVMRFDTDDLQRLADQGRLTDVVIHEIGHVLGIGTLWDDFGFLVNPSLPDNEGADTHFNGPRAIVAFDEVGGSNFSSGSKVPVENSQGEAGTRDSHWRESVFATEIMTGFIDAENPMSIVTVESLGDLGYVVNANAADSYSLLSAAAVSRLGGEPSEAGIQLVDDVRRGPIYMVERDGKITAVIRR